MEWSMKGTQEKILNQKTTHTQTPTTDKQTKKKKIPNP